MIIKVDLSICNHDHRGNNHRNILWGRNEWLSLSLSPSLVSFFHFISFLFSQCPSFVPEDGRRPLERRQWESEECVERERESVCVCREREREAGNGQTCLAGPSGRRNWWWDTATVPFPVPSPPLIRDGRYIQHTHTHCYTTKQRNKTNRRDGGEKR